MKTLVLAVFMGLVMISGDAAVRAASAQPTPTAITSSAAVNVTTTAVAPAEVGLPAATSSQALAGVPARLQPQPVPPQQSSQQQAQPAGCTAPLRCQAP